MSDFEAKAIFSGGTHTKQSVVTVRVTHKPSGLFCESQSERSIDRNAKKAYKKLQLRLKRLNLCDQAK